MPIHKDVKKRLKTSLKAKTRNREFKSQMKTLIKNVEINPAPKNLKKLFSSLDKATRKNVIHKSKASRIKSRFSILTNKATKPDAEVKAKA